MTPPPSLREATAGDIPRINVLLDSVGLSPLGRDEAPSTFFVAEENGTLVGAVGLERYGRSGLLRSAAVVPGMQRRGLGRLLVDAVVSRARTEGLTEVVLLTETAEAWFRRRGFTAVERGSLRPEILASSQLTGGCPSSAVVMRMALSGA